MVDAPKPAEKPKMVKVTVAGRQTVYHDGEIHLAGEEFEASESDVALLTKHGFLVDPNAPPPPLPEGARVGLVRSDRR